MRSIRLESSVIYAEEKSRELLDPRQRDVKASRTRLKVAEWVQEFKHQLSVATEHTDELPVGDFEVYQLSRQAFEGMIEPFIQTTCELCQQLVKDAGLNWEQVGRVLMVGGSCRIPYLRQVLEREFKRPVVRVDEPELAVCLGAAIYMAKQPEPQSVAPQSVKNTQKKRKQEEIEQRNAETYLKQGNVHFSQGDYQSAIADFNLAISFNPDNAHAYNNRGWAYYRLNDYQRAIDDYNQAISLNRDYADAYYNRGNVYYNLKEYQRAIADFEQALKINPHFSEALNCLNLARSQLMWNQEEIERRNAETYLKQGNFKKRIKVAEIQFARGVTEDAIPEFRLTRSRNGQSGTATFYL